MRGSTRGLAERERLISLYRSSGVSAREFAAREGMAESTLYAWLSGKPKRRTEPVRIARVIRKPAPALEWSSKRSPIVLQVCGIQVAVTADFEERALAKVLDVVESRRSGGR